MPTTLVQLTTVVNAIALLRERNLPLVTPDLPISTYRAGKNGKLHSRAGCAGVFDEHPTRAGEMHLVGYEQWCRRCWDHGHVTMDEAFAAFLSEAAAETREYLRAERLVNHLQEASNLNPVSFVSAAEVLTVLQKWMSVSLEERPNFMHRTIPDRLVGYLNEFEEELSNRVAALQNELHELDDPDRFRRDTVRAAKVGLDMDVRADLVLAGHQGRSSYHRTSRGRYRELWNRLYGSYKVENAEEAAAAIVSKDRQQLNKAIPWVPHLSVTIQVTPRFRGGSFTTPLEWAQAEWEAYRDDLVDQYLALFEEELDGSEKDMVIFGCRRNYLVSSDGLLPVIRHLWHVRCDDPHDGLVGVAPRAIVEYLQHHSNEIRFAELDMSRIPDGDIDMFLQLIEGMWSDALQFDEVVDTAYATLS